MAAFSVSATKVAPAKQKTSADSDPALVARAREGNEDAFASLYRLHKRRVYSLCLLMTGDVAKAEDLTQEAFIQVFRKLSTFRGDSTFSTWLYRVAVNTVLMNLRRRKPEQISYDEPVQVGGASVGRDFGQNDPELSGTVDRVALIRAINELPEGCRTIFILHEIEGYQHHEIARLLECSAGNSKSQLHKARMKLRELLLPHTRRSSRIEQDGVPRSKRDRDKARKKASSSKPAFVRLAIPRLSVARIAERELAA